MKTIQFVIDNTLKIRKVLTHLIDKPVTPVLFFQNRFIYFILVQKVRWVEPQKTCCATEVNFPRHATLTCPILAPCVGSSYSSDNFVSKRKTLRSFKKFEIDWAHSPKYGGGETEQNGDSWIYTTVSWRSRMILISTLLFKSQWSHFLVSVVF